MPSLFELLKNEKKVCIITTYFPPYPKDVKVIRGGVTEEQLELYDELAEHGVKVFVISPSYYGRSPPAKESRVYRVGTYIPYSKSRIRRLLFPILEFFNPLVFYKVVKILNQEKPTAIMYAGILQSSMAPLIASLLFTRNIFVRNDWLCPNLYAQAHPCTDIERLTGCANCLGVTNIILKPLIGLYSVLMRRIKIPLWNMCWITVQSDYHRKLLLGWGVNPKKVVYAPPTSRIGDDEEFTEELRRAKGNEIALGYIGRLTEEKGFGLLLEAFKLVRERHPHTLLFVAGSGNLRREEDGVVYLGWVEKRRLGSVYKIVDMVIVPTIVPEAHPAVVEDALKYEKPIIAFKRGALEEMIGNKGILIDDVSVGSLYQAIMKAISDIRDYQK